MYIHTCIYVCSLGEVAREVSSLYIYTNVQIDTEWSSLLENDYSCTVDVWV